MRKTIYCKNYICELHATCRRYREDEGIIIQPVVTKDKTACDYYK